MQPLIDVWAAAGQRGRTALSTMALVGAAVGAGLGDSVATSAGLTGGDALYAVLVGALVVPVLMGGVVSLSILGAVATEVAE